VGGQVTVGKKALNAINKHLRSAINIEHHCKVHLFFAELK